MKNQTAVEWLVQQIETGKIEIVYSDKIHSIRCLPEFVKAAIEMEKQQIESAFTQGEISGADYFDPANPDVPSAVNYYNQTYKS